LPTATPTPAAVITPPSTPVATPVPAKPAEQKGGGFFSRIFSSNKPEEKKRISLSICYCHFSRLALFYVLLILICAAEQTVAQQPKSVQEQKKIDNVEEFAPAGMIPSLLFQNTNKNKSFQ
jgi:hypothetical protein